MKFKCIVFDFDDTLLETYRISFEMHNNTARSLGLRSVSKEEFFKAWGGTWVEEIKSLWPNVKVSDFQKMHWCVNKKYHFPLIKGAQQTINFLKKRGFLVGILSNRDKASIPIRAEKANLNLKLFDFVFSFEELGFSKPDARIFNPVLKELGKKRKISKKEIVYVGDSLVDFLPAKKQNIQFVAVLTGLTKKEHFLKEGLDEKFIIDSVAEIPKLFEENSWLK